VKNSTAGRKTVNNQDTYKQTHTQTHGENKNKRNKISAGGKKEPMHTFAVMYISTTFLAQWFLRKT
jgi:hypothetical protein